MAVAERSTLAVFYSLEIGVESMCSNIKAPLRESCERTDWLGFLGCTRRMAVPRALDIDQRIAQDVSYGQVEPTE